MGNGRVGHGGGGNERIVCVPFFECLKMKIANERTDPGDIIHSRFSFKARLERTQGQTASELLLQVTMKLDFKGHGWKLYKPLVHVIKFLFRSGLSSSFPVRSLKTAVNDCGEGTHKRI